MSGYDFDALAGSDLADLSSGAGIDGLSRRLQNDISVTLHVPSTGRVNAAAAAVRLYRAEGPETTSGGLSQWAKAQREKRAEALRAAITKDDGAQ